MEAAYLLFRFHDWEPRRYFDKEISERVVLRGFLEQEMRDREEEKAEWRRLLHGKTKD